MPRALEVDLTRATVFLDFDGTIVRDDTGLHLLERVGTPGWQPVADAYVRGEIGSRECLIDEWSHLPKDEELLRDVCREVPVDPGVAGLVRALQDAGAEVVVVSDGYGFYAREVCEPWGLEVVANAIDWSTGELQFPNEDRCCPCSTCGTCKQAPIKDANRRGRTTVLVGDGASDRKAALLADVVFAKAGLAVWCSRNDVRYVPFDTLRDVQAALVP